MNWESGAIELLAASVVRPFALASCCVGDSSFVPGAASGFAACGVDGGVGRHVAAAICQRDCAALDGACAACFARTCY